MTDLATLGIRINSAPVVGAANDLDKLSRAANDADRNVTTLGRSSSAAFSFMKGALVGIGSALAAAFSGNAFLKASQEFTDIQNQLRVAGVEAKNLEASFNSMYAAAQRQGASVSGITELFSRTMTAGRSFGVTEAGAAEFAEGIATALRASGTSATEAAGALRQLGQALGSGTVQAEEFNSIMDGIPLGAQAMANGLREAGGSVSNFRNLVREGKVSSEDMFRAFMAGLPTVQAMADRALPTVAQASQRVGNSFLVMTGNFDKILGVTDALGRSFNSLAMWIESNARPAAELFAREIADMWPQIANASTKILDFILVAGGLPLVTTAIMGVVGAVKALTLAMLANPIGMMVTALVVAAGAAYAFRDEISRAIGIDVVQIVKDAANGTIGLFKGAFDAIVAGVAEIPAAFRKAFTDAMNGAVRLVETGINGMISAFRRLPRMNGIPLADLSGFMSPDAPDASVGGAMGRAFGDARGVDYLGNMASGVRNLGGRVGQTLFGYAAPNQEENAARRRDASTVGLRGPSGGAGGGAGGGGGGAASGPSLSDQFEKEIAAIDRRAKALENENNVIGLSTYAIERNRIESQLKQSLEEKGLALTPTRLADIERVSHKLAENTATLERNRESWRGTQDAIRFAGQSFTGFVSDVVSGGRNASEALMNLLKRLADVALQAVFLGEGPLAQMFGTRSVVSGGVGGIFGSLFGGLGKPTGFANGGVFTNSVVSKPTPFMFANGASFGVMGEAGPEAVMPLHRGPNGVLGVKAANGNGDPSGRVEVIVTVAPSGEFDSRVARVSGAVSSATVKQALTAFAPQVPGIVADAERRRA